MPGPAGRSDDRPCVLVVDDDPVLRRFIRAVLEGVGIRVEEAADGPEAFGLLESLTPQVVLLDVMLPGDDGVTVMNRLAPSGVRVLMLTGVDDPDIEDSALAAGALGYLTKPFSPRELLDQIEGLLAP
jgi:DNA-binding response OmpR family regulator